MLCARQELEPCGGSAGRSEAKRLPKSSRTQPNQESELFTTPFFHPYVLGCLTGTRRGRLRKKSTSDALRHVAVSHEPRFLHRIARDLRQHSVRRDETVLDGGDNLILVSAVLEL